MVLGEDDHYPLTTGLTILLWVEVIVYGFFGLLLFFSVDFVEKKRKLPFHKNNFDIWMHRQHEQIHACLAFFLGYVALQGLLAGFVTRFELEILFVTLGMIMGMVWTMPPGLTFIVLLLKPEFWIQLVTWACYSPLVRPQVLVVAALFNLYGIGYKLIAIPKMFGCYADFHNAMVESVGEWEMVAKFDMLARYSPPNEKMTEPMLP